MKRVYLTLTAKSFVFDFNGDWKAERRLNYFDGGEERSSEKRLSKTFFSFLLDLVGLIFLVFASTVLLVSHSLGVEVFESKLKHKKSLNKIL
jgi:hypothetical protein